MNHTQKISKYSLQFQFQSFGTAEKDKIRKTEKKSKNNNKTSKARGKNNILETEILLKTDLSQNLGKSSIAYSKYLSSKEKLKANSPEAKKIYLNCEIKQIEEKSSLKIAEIKKAIFKNHAILKNNKDQLNYLASKFNDIQKTKCIKVLALQNELNAHRDEVVNLKNEIMKSEKLVSNFNYSTNEEKNSNSSKISPKNENIKNIGIKWAEIKIITFNKEEIQMLEEDIDSKVCEKFGLIFEKEDCDNFLKNCSDDEVFRTYYKIKNNNNEIIGQKCQISITLKKLFIILIIDNAIRISPKSLCSEQMKKLFHYLSGKKIFENKNFITILEKTFSTLIQKYLKFLHYFNNFMKQKSNKLKNYTMNLL